MSAPAERPDQAPWATAHRRKALVRLRKRAAWERETEDACDQRDVVADIVRRMACVDGIEQLADVLLEARELVRKGLV